MLKPSLKDIFHSSIKSILKNKSRTILTSLGIIIGVTSVILLTSIGNGLKDYVTEQFNSLGANSIYIYPGQVFSDDGGFSSGTWTTNTFTQKDINNLTRQFREFTIMPVNSIYVEVSSSKNSKDSIEVNGTDYQYGSLNNLTPSTENGRWFTKEENDKKTPVAILGYQIALDLFPGGNALGKKIIINGKTLKVIGVLDQKGGGMSSMSIDSNIFVPISIGFDLAGNEDINAIVVKIQDKDSVELVKKELEDFMLKRYEEDTFSVFDSSQLLSSINSIISVLTAALSGIAAISLIVGGIGIMNIMLVSVTERTKEIGLRKAIGASPRAILIQFLIEAIILSCLGGTIGIILGFIGTTIINSFFPASITLSSIILAFGVSSAVGIIFGVTPAKKASKLSPIEALRYE